VVYLLLPVVTVLGTWVGNFVHRKVDVNGVLLVLQLLVLLSTVSLTSATDGSTFAHVMLVLYAIVVVALGSAVALLATQHSRFIKSRPHLKQSWQHFLLQKPAEPKEEHPPSLSSAPQPQAVTFTATGELASIPQWHV